MIEKLEIIYNTPPRDALASAGDMLRVFNKINELIDAVNKLEKRGLIHQAVKKMVDEYGEALKKLGEE